MRRASFLARVDRGEVLLLLLPDAEFADGVAVGDGRAFAVDVVAVKAEVVTGVTGVAVGADGRALAVDVAAVKAEVVTGVDVRRRISSSNLSLSLFLSLPKKDFPFRRRKV